MKTRRVISYLFLLGLMTSCHSHRPCTDEVVCETVHRYGVPLEPTDWASRGRDGQVVSLRKDGATVTRTYNSGILEGETTYTFPNRNVIQKRDVYSQGNITEETWNYPTGFPLKRITYLTPTQKKIVMWYENGAPQSQEILEGNLLMEGEYYHHDDHHVESHVENFNGLRTCRNGLGEMESVDKIENGSKVLSVTYHPNKIPASLTPYENGKIQGLRYTYFSGGEPATIEEWVGGCQNGITVVYDQGEKIAEIPYVRGCKHGVARYYRADGHSISREETWCKGQVHGPVKHYMGNTCQVDWYYRDKQVPNKATYDMLCNQ